MKKIIVINNKSSSGFTLIEVIVAVAILGISLVMVMQLFSAGLRSARTSCDYTRAIVHAKDKMAELSYTLLDDRGEFEDGFRWESGTEDHKLIDDSVYKLLKLKVKIYWPDVEKSQRDYELVSLKLTKIE